MEVIHDKNGRQIMPGDLLKVPHFRAYNRRNVYMYKLVVRVDGMSKVCDDGEYLYGVNIGELRSKPLNDAHKYRLSWALEGVEIIDDDSSNPEQTWWERRRLTPPSPKEPKQ
jgi:hypothetical protein